nr:hypothetical protein [Desulfuribacillus stibiiarsenatis]
MVGGLVGDKKSYDISKIDEQVYADHMFYKGRWVKEDDFEQKLIVTWIPANT